MLFVTTWMDLEGIMPSEISYTEKDKYCIACLIFGIRKTIQKNKLMDTENRLVVARGRGWGLAKWVKVVKRYELPVKK